MVKRVYLISKDIFLFCLNEKWLYGFLILALLFVSIVNIPFWLKDLEPFKEMPPEKNALQVGLFFINVFLVLISVFLSVIGLSHFLSSERISLILSKPVRRSEYILGIISGLYFVLLLNWFILVSTLFFILFLHTKYMDLSIYLGMLPSVLLSFICIGLVIFFYTIIPNFLSGILSLFVLLSGFGLTLEDIKKSEHLFLGRLIRLGAIFLPKVNSLFGISFDMLEIFEVRVNKLSTILHTVIFIFVLNLISVYRFKRSYTLLVK